MRRLSRTEEAYPDYFDWLCEMVCVEGRYTDEAYWELAKALWDTDFYYSISMDANRAADGLDLRDRYTRAGGTDGYSGPCTVLEVLVALADRMDNMYDEMDGECKAPIFFWEMIENLGLENYSDTCFDDNPDRAGLYLQRIHRKVATWLDRDFEYDGTGSPFPLERPRGDQRDTELWYQMNGYLIEHYL